MEIVANKEVIAINQDSLGVQAKKVRSEDLGRSSFGLQRSLGAQDFDKIIHSLQVRKNGEWIPVTPAQGTLVVNLGDVIQVLSNNKFRSATHRVVCILL
ncbi:hypothetical protein LWI28_027953 [Acer negundo]|uniref:Isopenicillin N synthase-like Fe(2+) 2OG dioxygenase domain-containing protein n=1 Tax=Acer negundo TaxID=4023 RepID=A0AAD5IHJ6_ACENE|nr:hypothetical protein LWI28_027953 [Acer negundo]